MSDETFSSVVSTTNENLVRLGRSVALTASTVLSGESSVGNPSAYQRTLTDVVTYRKRLIASKIKENSPGQAIRQELVRKIGGVRAPQLSDELLHDIPVPRTIHSLFQTFEATVPNTEKPRTSTGGELVIRKEMAASELMEIDEKIAALRDMRKLVFERMATVEHEQQSDEPTLQHYYPSGELIKLIASSPQGDNADAGASDRVVDVDFNSPFGQLALTRGRTVELHELNRDDEEATVLRPIASESSRITCLVVYGSDPIVVAGVGADVNVWQGHTPTVLSGHVADILAVDYDGESIVSASADNTVREWDEHVGKNTATIDMYTYGTCRALQHAGNALATGSEDGVVRLWDMRASYNRPQRELRGGHISGISSLHFSGLEMVSGSLDGSVRIWDLRSGNVAHAEAYPQSVTSLSFDATKVVSSVRGERGVRVLSRTTNEHRLSAMDTSAITAAKYMKGYLVTGRESGEVGIWAV